MIPDMTLLGSVKNDARFSRSLAGFPLDKPKKAVLNNRGKLNAMRIIGPAPASSLHVDFQNNMGAGLHLTQAFGGPGVTFKADWANANSFCLTYFQWGPGMWAQQEPV